MVREAGMLVVVLLLAECSNSPGAGTASQQDRQSILATVRGGMAAQQTALIPTSPACPGPLPQSARDNLVAQAPALFGAYFTSPQLENEIALVVRVVGDPKGGPACVFGGGVAWVRLDSVDVTGTSAHAKGQVRAWSRVAGGTAGRMAEPHNTLDTSFDLQRVDGQWLISGYKWTFAAGSEP